MGNPSDPRFSWDDMPEPLEERIQPWKCEFAKEQFLWWAEKLGLAGK